MTRRPWIFALLGCVFAAASTTRADLRDDFESAEPAWRDAGGDARYRFDVRQRVAEQPYSGRQCEFVQFTVEQGGRAVYLSYDLGRAPVIDETTAALWVRGDRPGMQLSARVVFPRSVEPRSGQPLSALIVGSSYSKPGNWERLTLVDVRRQVEQQARVLRAQLRIPVETEQAYLDRILVNAYCGTGATRVWFDDLTVGGVVRRTTEPHNENVSKSRDVAADGSPATAARVELRGQTLTVDGRPFFPRLIEHRGEPLTLLQQLGFNTVRLSATPSRETLDEAKHLGLWLICPPPRPPDLNNPYGAAADATSGEFGPWFDPVLAWDLGDRWTADDFEVLKRWTEYVRRHDQPRPRPLLGGAVADVRMVSRQVDVVELRRRPLGTTFQLGRYGDWLRERTRLTRPGTPIWTTIQTEPTPERLQQARLLADLPIDGVPLVESEQVRLMLYEALAAGVRGVGFESQTPLTADDVATRLRAATLQVLNLELELIDVWTSSGTFTAHVPGSDPDVSAALLQIDRGHLLLPMWTGDDAQYVPGQSAGLGVSFVVPGVPETVDVLEITPGGMRPLSRKRIAGGLKITLDEFSLTSLVLLTQDPQVVAALAQRLATVGRAAADRQRALVEAKLRLAEDVHGRLSAEAPRVPQAGEWLSAANNALRTADNRQAEGNLRDAYLDARRALRPLALLERAHWRNAVEAAGSANVGPFTASFATLPQFWQMHRRLQVTRSWESVLPGGDFENLDATLADGWRHYQHEQPGIRSDAELSALARRETATQFGGIPNGAAAGVVRPGRLSLRLAAQPLDQAAADAVVETPPVWITSPAVPASAGQLLRVSGWVYVPKPIAGSLDGLVVFDSIGGESGAERFEKTNDWKRFTFYRVVPHDGVVTLTAALSGFGEAYVDDLTIEVVR